MTKHITTDQIIDWVKDFMTAMGQEPNVDLQIKLVLEEAKELDIAAHRLAADRSVENMESFLKEAGDFMYVLVGLNIALEAEVMAGVRRTHDATSATMIFAITQSQAHIEAAMDVFLEDDELSEIIRRIHVSNMSKLGEDGKPIKDETGKVLKGPNYAPPMLTDIASKAHELYEGYALMVRTLSGISNAA